MYPVNNGLFSVQKAVFSPSGTCRHGVFSIYAIIAQLDRALASDNCDMAGFWLVFARYSAICTCKNAVVNGSQTTN